MNYIDIQNVGVSYTSTGSVAIAIPSAAALTNASQTYYEISDIGLSAGTNNIVITPDAGTIDGAASYTIDKNGASLTLRNDGTNWVSTNNTQRAVDNSGATNLSTVLAAGATTGGTDITMSTDDTLKAASGNTELTLRNGSNSTFAVTTDSLAYGNGSAWVFLGENDSAQLAVGNGNGSASAADMAVGIGVFDDQGFAAANGNAFSILIQKNDASNATTPALDNPAIIIGSKSATVNSGIVNSVILGGSGTTAVKSNTVYIGQDIVVANNISTVEGELNLTSTNTTTGLITAVNSTMTNSVLVDLTSDSLTTGTGIRLRTDNITTGDMLYLDNGGGTMTGDGKFINCNDDNASVFSVSTNGKTFVGGGFNYEADTGSADTYAIAVPIVAYETGQMFSTKVANDNTGACTLNVNAVGAKNIKTQTGADPAAGDLDATGWSLFIYDGTNMVLINPATTTD
jgi:hypothetical protein